MSSENINYNRSINSDEISLKELILKIRELTKYLLSKWLIIIAFLVIGGALGFIYASFKRTVYVATTTFVLEDDKTNGGLGSLAGIASIAGVDLGGGGGGIFQGDNILELYRSRKMIEKTLLTEVDNGGKNKLLIDCYIDFNKLRGDWDKNPKLKDIKFVSKFKDSLMSDVLGSNLKRLQDSVLNTIVADINQNYLSVAKPDKKLSIIRADVRSVNEFFAKNFNEQIVRNVNDFYLKTKSKKSSENVSILQQNVDSVRAVMNGAIYNAAAVTDATPNLNPTRQTQRVVPVQRSQFSAETNKEILSELVKSLEMSKMALRKEIPLLQIVDEPIFPLEKEILSKTKSAILGGAILVFLALLFLLIRKIFNDILI